MSEISTAHSTQQAGALSLSDFDSHSSSLLLPVQIIYDNIKSAFYQPAEEGSHNVTIHFELKDPILLDKTKVTKKTSVRTE